MEVSGQTMVGSPTNLLPEANLSVDFINGPVPISRADWLRAWLLFEPISICVCSVSIMVEGGDVLTKKWPFLLPPVALV